VYSLIHVDSLFCMSLATVFDMFTSQSSPSQVNKLQSEINKEQIIRHLVSCGYTFMFKHFIQ